MTIRRTDNGNVRVHVDCCLKSGAVRQYFVSGDGEVGREVPEESTSFVQLLGRAFRWRDLLVSGTYRGKTDLARALGVDKANLIGSMRLPYLSPVIIDKAVRGELEGASVRRYHRITSPFWYDQHKALGLD